MSINFQIFWGRFHGFQIKIILSNKILNMQKKEYRSLSVFSEKNVNLFYNFFEILQNSILILFIYCVYKTGPFIFSSRHFKLIFLSIYPSIYPSFLPSIHLSFYLSILPVFYLSILPTIHLSIRLSNHLYIYSSMFSFFYSSILSYISILPYFHSFFYIILYSYSSIFPFFYSSILPYISILLSCILLSYDLSIYPSLLSFFLL